LDKVYAGAWETNLAITAELLAGTVAIPDHLNRSWTVPLTNSPRNITFQRIGSWAVLAVGPPHDPLAEEISTRLAQHDAPFVSSGTNFWLEASLRPARLAAVFPSAFANLKSQVSDVESLQLSFSGDGANVIARAKLNFSRPFTNLLAAWQLPLPLMHEPLTSFTAMRGIRPLLTALKWWPEFSGEITASAPPDQLFLWSLAGSPYQLYLAAPMADSRKWVADFSDRLMTRANPWLAANGYVSFARAADGNGVTWGSLPEIRPFIKSAGANSPNWLYAGLVPDSVTNPVPPPPGMIQDILQRTNLIYYDWEVTGPRLQPVLSVAQTARLVARCPQLSADSVSLAWLAALDPRLGTSATVVNRTGPAELTLLRRSTIGFTAPELQWLADWLESPRFPHGLHSAP
jgi:hypothetical protein